MKAPSSEGKDISSKKRSYYVVINTIIGLLAISAYVAMLTLYLSPIWAVTIGSALTIIYIVMMVKIQNDKMFLIYLIPTVGVVVLVVGLFFVDIGINSEYFVRGYFNDAFRYRMTGDCDNFILYVNRDIDTWKKHCESEKSKLEAPITDYKIKNISHRSGSNKASLQVEITRELPWQKLREFPGNNINTPKDITDLLGAVKELQTYTVTYEMHRDNFIWKIDQEIK